MPSKLVIDRDAAIVYSTLWGEITTPELRSHATAIREHPDFDPTFSELIDFSGITALQVSSADVQSLAMQESPFHPSARRVLVAPEDLTYGMARMFQSFGGESRPNLVIVRTLAEGRRRLGLKDT
ncbi:MAG: hypothetical protein JOZ44_07415 [Acidobacteria bacterium]|nr:hypothetical protein [Acidobacteriota bacterium]